MFKEWWDKEGKMFALGGLATYEDFARFAYRAGLLHAAEQDERAGMNLDKKGSPTGAMWMSASALSHAKAASEVK